MPNLTDIRFSLKAIILSSSLLLLCGLLPAQTQNNSKDYMLRAKVPAKARILTTDAFGNVYIVTHENELQKYDYQGNKLYWFNENRYGKISYVDATNPLKVLVHYADFSTIAILDNTLTQQGMIKLLDHGFLQVQALCLALDNNIWLYDEVAFRLKKLDNNLNLVTQSEDLSVQLGMTINPNHMLERDGYLWVNDPERGILVFDLFGTYYKTIPLKGLSSFQKVGEQIVYFKEGKLHTYHLQTLEQKTIALPPVTDTVQHVRLEKDVLALITKNELALYAF